VQYKTLTQKIRIIECRSNCVRKTRPGNSTRIDSGRTVFEKPGRGIRHGSTLIELFELFSQPLPSS
jgi:hypothetical protein